MITKLFALDELGAATDCAEAFVAIDEYKSTKATALCYLRFFPGGAGTLPVILICDERVF